jgi:hypothetical protein
MFHLAARDQEYSLLPIHMDKSSQSLASLQNTAIQRENFGVSEILTISKAVNEEKSSSSSSNTNTHWGQLVSIAHVEERLASSFILGTSSEFLSWLSQWTSLSCQVYNQCNA